jgi:O-antigen/teichoic acid export membrane protein
MKQILRWRTGIGLACGLSGILMLLFVGQPLASFLLGPKYWFGNQLMIIIAAAHVLYVVGSGAVSWLIADKRLTALLKISAAAAASNVILNLFLLPRFGILGAGWSTLASYFLWVLLLAAAVYRTR